MKGGSKNMLSTILNFVGEIASKAGSSACMWGWFDEPKTPQSLIK